MGRSECRRDGGGVVRRDPGARPIATWVVVGPDGLSWVGLAENEADAWEVALGWPHPAEVEWHKQRGWYAAEATITWSKP